MTKNTLLYITFLIFPSFISFSQTHILQQRSPLWSAGTDYSNIVNVESNEKITIPRISHYRASTNSSCSVSLMVDYNNTWYSILKNQDILSDQTIVLEGPTKIKISASTYKLNSTTYTSRMTIFYQISTNTNINSGTISTNQRYATVIPENSKTSVNVILEQSTDLVNWSTVSPGQFSSSASKRFFRVRSANVPVSLTGATNASPIVITSTGHLLNTGDTISISGVVGNTAANGIFTITKVDANSFSLNGSTGNGAYSSGGTWLPNP